MKQQQRSLSLPSATLEGNPHLASLVAYHPVERIVNLSSSSSSTRIAACAATYCIVYTLPSVSLGGSSEGGEVGNDDVTLFTPPSTSLGYVLCQTPATLSTSSSTAASSSSSTVNMIYHVPSPSNMAASTFMVLTPSGVTVPLTDDARHHSPLTVSDVRHIDILTTPGGDDDPILVILTSSSIICYTIPTALLVGLQHQQQQQKGKAVTSLLLSAPAASLALSFPRHSHPLLWEWVGVGNAGGEGMGREQQSGFRLVVVQHRQAELHLTQVKLSRSQNSGSGSPAASSSASSVIQLQVEVMTPATTGLALPLCPSSRWLAMHRNMSSTTSGIPSIAAAVMDWQRGELLLRVKVAGAEASAAAEDYLGQLQLPSPSGSGPTVLTVNHWLPTRASPPPYVSTATTSTLARASQWWLASSDSSTTTVWAADEGEAAAGASPLRQITAMEGQGRRLKHYTLVASPAAQHQQQQLLKTVGTVATALSDGGLAVMLQHTLYFFPALQQPHEHQASLTTAAADSSSLCSWLLSAQQQQQQEEASPAAKKGKRAATSSTSKSDGDEEAIAAILRVLQSDEFSVPMKPMVRDIHMVQCVRQCSSYRHPLLDQLFALPKAKKERAVLRYLAGLHNPHPYTIARVLLWASEVHPGLVLAVTSVLREHFENLSDHQNGPASLCEWRSAVNAALLEVAVKQKSGSGTAVDGEEQRCLLWSHIPPVITAARVALASGAHSSLLILVQYLTELLAWLYHRRPTTGTTAAVEPAMLADMHRAEASVSDLIHIMNEYGVWTEYAASAFGNLTSRLPPTAEEPPQRRKEASFPSGVAQPVRVTRPVAIEPLRIQRGRGHQTTATS